MKVKLLGGNPQLRQAISFAIDRWQYARLFFYSRRAQVAYGFLPPLLSSYDLQIEEAVGPTFDPNKAL